MTNYVVLYTGGTYPEAEDAMAQVMADWGAWYGQLGDAVVDGGNPFNASKSIDHEGTIKDSAYSTPEITGYTIIAAESLDDALEKVKSHPHIKHGGQISVHQTFQM